jgi:hypothetical protein
MKRSRRSRESGSFWIAGFVSRAEVRSGAIIRKHYCKSEIHRFYSASCNIFPLASNLFTLHHQPISRFINLLTVKLKLALLSACLNSVYPRISYITKNSSSLIGHSHDDLLPRQGFSK